MKTSLILIGLASACTSDTVSSATQATTLVTPRPTPTEQMLCDRIVCFIHTTWDYDHDGVGDADEIAIGTDPSNFFSRAQLHDLIDRAAKRELPSFEAGQSLIMVLPTFGPAGQTVYGGEAMLPAKKSLLADIGIELPDGKVDLTDGFTLTRSLDGKGVEFNKMKWVLPDPPTADTTRDASADSTATAKALQGKEMYDVVIDNADDGLNMSKFSFTDQDGFRYSGVSESSPGYSKAQIETHVESVVDPSRYDQTITVTYKTDENGSETTTTTKLVSVDSHGKTTADTTVTTTTATSSDGRQTFWTTTTTHDGVTTSVSEECFDDKCTKADAPPQPVPDPAEDPDPDTAHRDPDYFEYQPSPEVVDATLAIRGGPVHTVDPLDGAGEPYDWKPVITYGQYYGVVSLYDPDASGTASVTDPQVIHLPLGGDYVPEAPQSPPPPQNGSIGGQCLYCNQGRGQ